MAHQIFRAACPDEQHFPTPVAHRKYISTTSEDLAPLSKNEKLVHYSLLAARTLEVSVLGVEAMAMCVESATNISPAEGCSPRQHLLQQIQDMCAGCKRMRAPAERPLTLLHKYRMMLAYCSPECQQDVSSLDAYVHAALPA